MFLELGLGTCWDLVGLGGTWDLGHLVGHVGRNPQCGRSDWGCIFVAWRVAWCAVRYMTACGVPCMCHVVCVVAVPAASSQQPAAANNQQLDWLCLFKITSCYLGNAKGKFKGWL